ncbi:hypothetical protein JCM13664_06690 [Methylothermus subterraneus]
MPEENPSPTPIKPLPRRMRNWLDEAVLIVLLLLSLGGAAISAFSAQDDYVYWLGMIPLFWLGAILSSWAQAGADDEAQTFRRLLWIELLHWGGTLAAVIGVFFLRYLQLLGDTAAVLVMLLILALSAYLNGIRIGWRFSLLGVFLGVTAMLAAYVQQFLPLAALLAVALIVFSIYTRRRRTRQVDHGA